MVTPSDPGSNPASSYDFFNSMLLHCTFRFAFPVWITRKDIRRKNYFSKPWRLGILAIASTDRTEDPGFEPLQCVRFLSHFAVLMSRHFSALPLCVPGKIKCFGNKKKSLKKHSSNANFHLTTLIVNLILSRGF
jgi:hypothetical protein